MVYNTYGLPIIIGISFLCHGVSIIKMTVISFAETFFCCYHLRFLLDPLFRILSFSGFIMIMIMFISHPPKLHTHTHTYTPHTHTHTPHTHTDTHTFFPASFSAHFIKLIRDAYSEMYRFQTKFRFHFSNCIIHVRIAPRDPAIFLNKNAHSIASSIVDWWRRWLQIVEACCLLL